MNEILLSFTDRNTSSINGAETGINVSPGHKGLPATEMEVITGGWTSFVPISLQLFAAS